MAGYSPKQREAYLKGMRILAQVAILAYMKRQAADFREGQDGAKQTQS